MLFSAKLLFARIHLVDNPVLNLSILKSDFQIVFGMAI